MAITQLLVNYQAANVRLFFRVYFIVLGLTVAPIGDACSSVAARLRITKRQNVELTKMFGWLGGIDCVTTIWKTRAFPSGFLLTIFMLAAFFVSLASDLVSAYIRSVSVHDRCIFGTGLVLEPTRSLNGVPYNGFPYTVVSQAQTISLANGGLQGIYAKVNQATDFSATADDVLGGWQCTQESLELDYSVSTDVVTVAQDLVSHNLIYHFETVSYIWGGSNSSIEHMVFVDASNDGAIGTPWDVRTSVSTNSTASNTNTMLSFSCKLHDKVGWLNNTLSGINAQTTIANWVAIIQGACYSGTGSAARSDLSGILERMFNTVVMIASGGNILLDSSQASSTQGCLTTRTWVLWEVIALAVLAALLNAILLIYLIVLKLLEMQARRRESSVHGGERSTNTKKELDKIPGGLLDWAVQAVRESYAPDNQPSQQNNDFNVEVKHLKAWKFGWLGWGNRCGILSRGHNVEEIQLLMNSSK